MEDTVYKLTGVTKQYRKGRDTVDALRGVDLDIAGGEWLAIQGPTGHGKSTLLQILGGLDRATSGTVDFDGRDLSTMREARVTRVRATSIGFIFQTFNLIATLSAQENVEAALVALGTPTRERRERAARALADVGLGDRLRHLPSELSGGQQQRVAIARALAKEPKVMLADEPTGNLDEGTRDEIIALLGSLWQDRGLTMVMVTHDSTVARRAQRIGLMKKGRLSIVQDTRSIQSLPAGVGLFQRGDVKLLHLKHRRGGTGGRFLIRPGDHLQEHRRHGLPPGSYYEVNARLAPYSSSGGHPCAREPAWHHGA
jgi:putative ABC transport system ATP-binding protein